MSNKSDKLKKLHVIRSSRAQYTSFRRARYLNIKRKGIFTRVDERKIKKSSLKKAKCPTIICLEENREETLLFLLQASSVNDRNRRQRRSPPPPTTSYFDFTPVEKICPSSALILCSVYDTLIRRGRKFHVYEWDDWKPQVKKVFERLGFFEWLKHSVATDAAGESELPIQSFQSFQSKSKADSTTTGTYVETLSKSIENFSELEDPKVKFRWGQTASAIIEAVENSVRHAYDQSYPKFVRQRWWIGGITDPKTRSLQIICYDAGVSIPAHIERYALDSELDATLIKKQVGKVLNVFKTKTNQIENDHNLDHKRLGIAMRLFTSSSFKSGSGRGLSSIASCIEQFTDGEVEILSRRAYYTKSKGNRPQSALLSSSLPGTLIIWKVSL